MTALFGLEEPEPAISDFCQSVFSGPFYDGEPLFLLVVAICSIYALIFTVKGLFQKCPRFLYSLPLLILAGLLVFIADIRALPVLIAGIAISAIFLLNLLLLAGKKLLGQTPQSEALVSTGLQI